MNERFNHSKKNTSKFLKSEARATDPYAMMLMELEQRIAFDGAAVETVENADDGNGAEPAGAEAEAAAESGSGDHDALVQALDQTAASAESGNEAPKQVVFIDSRVADKEALLSEIQGDHEVIILDAEKDGVTQIADALADMENVDAVHILSHGSAGSLTLGSTELDYAGITGEYADELEGLQSALSQDADILIYGCDFGQGAEGARATQALAALTGADVAASTDDTGAASLGGDWELEVATGTIEATALAAPEWDHLMAPPIVDLNSAHTAEVIANGGFDTGTDGWTTTGTAGVWNSGIGGFYQFANDNADGTLTQTDLSGWDSGFALSGAAQLTLQVSYNDQGTNTVRSTMDILIGDVLYARLFTPIAADPTTGRIAYFNGASGNTATFSGVGWTDLVIDLPDTVAADGDLEFVFSGVGGADNINFNSVSAITTSDSVVGADLDYTTAFVEGGAAVSIADADSSVSYTPGAQLQSARISLTNAFDGDDLEIGTLPTGIVASIDYSVSGQITMNLSGAASASDYADAIRAISFINLSDDPSTDNRVIEVTVSDGTTTSAPATATIEVTAVNDVPVVDLNSGVVSTEIVANGTLDGSGSTATGWTSTGGGAFGANGGQDRGWATNGPATLTQTGIEGWNAGSAPSGAAQLTFDLAWDNNADDQSSRLEVSIGGVVYAVFNGPGGGGDTVSGTVTYLNGATGSPATVLTSVSGTWTPYTITINLPADVAASGNLVFTYTEPNGASDNALLLDNISALTLVDQTEGVDYATTYTQGNAPVSIADSDSTVRDADSDTIQSASIVLTNALAGDELVVGTLPAGISASVNTATPGEITVALTGEASKADYAAAIRAIGFLNTGVSSEVPRVVEVTVNDGETDSAVATTTIHVEVDPSNLDSDGDGVVDTDDIDDDNDGIVDTLEYGTYSPTEYLGPSYWAVPTLAGATIANGNLGVLTDGDTALASQMMINPSGTNADYPDFTLNVAGSSSMPPAGLVVDTFVIANDASPTSGAGAGDGLRNITVVLYDVDGNEIGRESLTNLRTDHYADTNPDYYPLSQTYFGVGSFEIIAQSSYIYGPQDGNNTQLREIGLALSNPTTGPIDRDGDGVYDHLDLDSDDDGITDNVEAQTTAGYIAPSGVDADGDGLDDAYDANIGDVTEAGSLGLNPVDTDGDGTTDYLDDDSDNDGTPDIAERGDGQPTSITDTTDTDGDGLLDIFEGADVNDGFDPNDENIDASGNFSLADTDDDTDADGSNANPRGIDLDYRDDPSLQPPMVVDDTPTVNEDTTLTRDAASGLLSNDDVSGSGGGTITGLEVDTDGDGIADTPILIGTPTVINDSSGSPTGTLTVNADGSYTFVPAANFEGPVPVVTYTVTSPGGTGTANLIITVIGINDAPVLELSTTPVYSVPEDSPAPVGQVGSLISEFTDGITDVDEGAEKGIAVYFRSNSNGVWWYTADNGATWQQMPAVSTSNALLLADDGQTRIYFQPTTANYFGTTNNQLYFAAWDQSDGNASGTTGANINSRGGNTPFSQATAAIAREVTPVNDAPVLNDQNRQLITVNEDTTTGEPSGAVGTAVNYAYFYWSVSDVDTNADMNQRGIAITGTNEDNGVWWYTTDNGATWQQIGAVSDDNALLLEFSGNARVYFQANADYNTGTTVITDALTIRAWDQTSGANGGRADTTANGGTTAFSTATDTVSLDINPIADIVNDLSNTTAEDTATVIDPLANDTFENANAQIVEIDDQPITVGGPAVAVTNGSVVLNADGTITFTPAPDYVGTVNFFYTVESGGVTERAQIRVNVTAVADAPRIDLDTGTAGTGYTATYDQAAVSLGAAISVTDPENNNLVSMTIKIDNPQTGDALVLSQTLNDIGITSSYDPTTGTLTLTGNQSLARYQTALERVRFATNSTDDTARTISVSAVSGTAPTASNVAVATINFLDSDGDGVGNNADIDDDDDGIIDIDEGGEPDFEYATYTNITGTQANGVIGSTPFTITADQNITTAGSFANWNQIPVEFNVPNANPTLITYIVNTYTIDFGGPVTNPVIAFGSIGQGGIAVPISFSAPIDVLWSSGGLSVDSDTQITGREGNAVVQLTGEFTSFTFSFLVAENHTAFAIGANAASDVDTDADGVVDRLDLDSDNDGITDNVEGQTTAGYIAPSGQGAGKTDADGDGLDDAYDADTSDTSTAASRGTGPADTDLDGTADFRDADSDNDGTADIAERGDGQPTSVTSTTDTDSDGLLDIFEGSDVGDGRDVNDENISDAGIFNLADSDDDTAADGSDARPLGYDLDFRDDPDALDSDGDRIVDLIDIDDDNDGIVDSVEKDFAPVGPVNLTEGLAGGQHPGDMFLSQGFVVEEVSTTDYTTVVDTNFEVISHSGDSDNKLVFAGNNALSFRLTGPDGDYAVDTVSIMSDPAPAGNVTVVAFDLDGNDIYRAVLPDGQTYTVDTTLTGGTLIHRLAVYNGSTAFDQFAYSAPTSQDSDGDGADDHLDLDADNDGITDNVEAQTTAGYITPSGVDADGDGLDDAYDANIGDVTETGSVGLIPVDTDGDGTQDYVDDDSDDDGVLDVVERGDGQPTSITDITDTDGDGLLDIFEGADINDGFDPNDENIDDSGIFNLADSDDDTAADGSDARPLINDLDYRDDPLNVDTDGDGVFDIDDIDDDNDGIVDSAEGLDNTVIVPITTTNINTDNIPPLDYNGQTINITSTHDGTVLANDSAGEIQFDFTEATPEPSLNLDFDRPVDFLVTSRDGTGGFLLDDVDVITVSSPGATIIVNDPNGELDIASGIYAGTVSFSSASSDSHDGTWSITVVSTTSVQLSALNGSPVTNPGNGGTALKTSISAVYRDEDGDGVDDHLDLDSDNDGITDNIEAQATAGYIAPSGVDADGDGLDDAYDQPDTELVTNGTFAGDTLDGWTTTGQVEAYNETMAFNRGNSTNYGDARQTIATVPGQSYTLTFDVGRIGGGSGMVGIDAQVLDGATVLGDEAVNKTNSSGTTSHSITFVATSAQTTILFDDTSTATIGIDIFVDNVSVEAIPGLIPVDTDGDGTSDYLDDDSDNDGTPDIAERGDGQPTSITDTTDTDGDGLLDIFEGADINDGFDPNDENIDDSGIFNLADSDNDTAADGSDAAPTEVDLDYRDDVVNAVPPVLDLDGDDSSGATNADYATSYTEGSPGVAIADTDLVITDSDSANMAGATVTLTNPQAGDRLLVDGSDAASGTLASGITWTRTDSEVTLSGSFSTADYQAALQLITFMSTSMAPPAVTRTVTVNVTDDGSPASQSNTATAAITVVPVNDAPVVDLNSGVTPTEIITNGSFADGLTGWTLESSSPNNGHVPANFVRFEGDNSTAVLTSDVVGGWDEGLAPSGAAQLSFLIAWRNGGAGETDQPSTMDVTVGGVLYARISTGVSGGTTATVEYFNGASGNMDSVPTPGINNLIIDLPADVPPSGSVAFAFDSTGGTDGFDIDGVSVLTSQPAIAPDATPGVDFATGYTENDAPVSIADVDSDVRDVDDTMMESATIVLTNAQAGDALSVIGSLPAGISSSIDTSVPGQITVTLTGTASNADYSAAIRAIGYSSSSDNPSAVDRIIEVKVNDGDLDSPVATTTITVTPVNDVPVAVDDALITPEDTPITFDPRGNDTDADGDALTITEINGAPVTVGAPVSVAGGTVTLNANGTLSFTPTPNFNGTPSFTYTIDDGNGGTDEATVTITITPVADAPVNTVPGAQTTAEDTVLSFTAAGGNAITVADVDSGTLTVTLSVTNGTLSLSDTTGLTFTTGDGSGDATMTFQGSAADINAALEGAFYRPTADYNGSAELNIVTSDGTLSDSDTVAITVTPVVDIADDNATTDENAPVEINVLANDTFENTGRAITAVNGTAITAGGPAVAVANGTVSLTTDGNLIYTPALNYNGAASFTYTVTSGGVTETATVNVSVAAVNAPPVNTLPASFNTLEDTALALTGLSVADNDAGTGTMTVTLSVDSGTLAAAAAAGVTVSGSGTGTLTLSGTLINLNAYLSGASAPSFTPAANSIASVTLTMVTNDNGNTGGPALTDTDTSTITITPVNDAPAGTDKTVTVDEDTSYSFTASDFGFSDPSDSPGNSLQSVIITTVPASGTLTLGGVVVTAGQEISAANIGQLQWAPDAGTSGAAYASFTFQVRDNGGTSNGGQDTDQSPNIITFNVTAVNDAPINTLPSTYGVDEDNAMTLTGLSIADVDVASGEMTITLSVDSGTLTAASATGVTVTGSGGASITLTGTLTDLNAYLASGSAPVFQPSQDFNGTVTLTMVTNDQGNTGTGGPLSDTDTASIVVAPVNDPPVGADDAITTPEDTAFTGTLPAATDVDGDTLTYGAGATAPANGTVTINPDGTYTYTPDPQYNGSDSFTYTVSDGTVTVEYTVDVTVTPESDPPVATDDTVITPEDTPVTFDPRDNDTDADGDPLTITEIDGTPISPGTSVPVEGGSVTMEPDGSLTFIPDGNYNGNPSFTYTISDPDGNTDEGTVNLTVTPVNDTPTSTPIPDQLSNDSDTVSLDLSGAFSDADGDSLTYSATGLPPGLSIDPDTGAISGTLDSSASTGGPYGVTVTATDPGGLTASRSFTWEVMNPAPVAANDSLATTENAAISGSILTDNGNGADIDPDGDTITVTRVDNAAANVGAAVTGTDGGTFTINSDGSYSFDPGTDFDDLAAGATRLTTVTYTISDGEGGTATATVEVIVTGENDAPIAMDDTFTTSEDTPITFDLRGNDSDPDGDPLTVTHIDGNPIAAGGSVVVDNGTVTLNADGTLTFTPDADFNGSLSFGYTISDGTDIASATVTGTVNAVNDAPVATDDSFTTEEDTPATIDVLVNDTDVDGDSLTVIEVNGGPIAVGTPVTVTGGTVALQADGTLIFTPDTNYNGDTSFTYRVSDGNGGTATATVTGTVTPDNDPPVAADTTVSTSEDTPINQTLPAATDPDGDTVTYSAGGTPPDHGTLTINPDGSYTYTPDPDFNGTDSFTYIVDDGNGGTNEYTVTVEVGAENDAPVADEIGDMVRADNDTVSIDLSPFFADPDGDPLNYVITGLPAGLTYDPATGVISGTIDREASQNGPNSDGIYTVTVTAYDRDGATGLSVAETFTLSVTNPGPTAVNDTATTDEDTPVTILVLTNDTDPDGDPLTVTEANAGNGAVTINPDGTLTYTPDGDFNGTDTITYTIDDGNGGVSTAQVTVTVNAINDAPVASDIPDQVDDDSADKNAANAFDISVYFDDVDGDALTFSVMDGGLPGGLSLDPATGVISGTIDADASSGGPNNDGVYQITIAADDGNGGTVTETFTWFVSNPPPGAFDDTLPGISEDSGTTNVDAQSGLLDNDVDPDGDPITVTAVNGIPLTGGTITVTGSNGGTFVVNADGSYSFNPGEDFQDLQDGETRVTTLVYTATDTEGLSDTATLTVIVTGLNDAPTVDADGLPDVTKADSASLAAEPLDMSEYFHDVESDTLTYGASGLPDGLSIDPNTGEITGTIASDASQGGPGNDGVYTVTITADDGNGGQVSGEFTFTVTNPAPTAVNDAVTTPEDTAIDIDVLSNDTDPDGDTLSVDTVVPPEAGHGTVTLNPDGTLHYVPDENFNGIDTIVYRITDGQGGFSTATVTVTVSGVNDVPTLDLDASEAGLDYAATFTEGDAPVAVADIDATAFDVEDEIVSLDVTLAGFADGGAEVIHLGSSATVTVGTASSGTASFGGTTFAYDYNPLTGLSITNSAGATEPMPAADINELLRAITYESTTENPTAGDRTLTFSVTDLQGATSADAVSTITVVPVNDPPVAVNDAETTDEDTAISNDALPNDSDPEGDPLTITAVNGAAGSVGTNVTGSTGGQFTVNADGTYSFDPSGDFEHLAPGESEITSVTYTVSDGQGGSATAVITVTVTGVNDAPAGADDAITINEDTPFTGQLPTATDPDGDPITYGSGTPPANGTVIVNPDGSYTYTPNPDFNGADSFTYTVSDGTETVTYTVDVTVNPVNDPPVAVDDTVTTDEDTPVNFDPLGNDTDVDGDPLTITAIDGNPIAPGGSVPVEGGTVTLNIDGTITFAPNPDYNGKPSFTYTVDDGNGGTDTATVNLTVNPVNDAPIAVDDSAETTENAPVGGNVILDVPGRDSDVDGDALTVTAVGGTGAGVGGNVAGSNGGTFVINGNGAFNFDPGSDFDDLGAGETRVTTVTYTVSDGHGGTDTATLTVTVTGTNDAPVAPGLPPQNDVDGASVTYPAGDVFSDADGDTLTFSATGLPPGLSINSSTGAITGTLDSDASQGGPNSDGIYQVTITADDSNGGEAERSFVWTVTNPAPTAVDDAFTTLEDTPIVNGQVLDDNGSGADTDPDGDTLTVSLVSGPTHGTLVLNSDGTFTYTPDENYHGNDSFTYRVDDGNGGTDTATVRLTVTSVNDLPAGTDKTVTIDEDTSYGFNIADFGFSDADPEDDLVSVTITTLPTNGLLTLQGVAVTAGQSIPAGDIAELAFTPDADENGDAYASFTFQVNDGTDLDPTPNTFTINVDPVNDAPVNSLPDGYTTNEDTALPLTGLSVADVDAGSGTISVTLSVDAGRLSAASGGGVAVSGSGTGSIVLTGSLDAINAWLAGSSAPVYTPVADSNAPVTLTMVTDDRGNTGSGGPLSDVDTVKIIINPVNDGPKGSDTTIRTPEDTPISGEIQATDPDGDDLTFTLIDQPENGTVILDPSSGEYQFKPDPDFHGETSFDVEIDDGHGGKTTVTVTVTVTPVNDEPVGRDTAFVTPEDTSFTGMLPPATDVDGDPITYGGPASGPSHGTVTVHPDGRYTYTPDPNYNGPDSFTYIVSDGKGGDVIYTVAITVTPVNDAPIGGDGTTETEEDTPVTDKLPPFTDPDGDPLTYGTGSQPGNGTVIINKDGTFTYIPNPGFTGTDSFTFTVSDGTTTVTYTMFVVVTPAEVDDRLLERDPPRTIPDRAPAALERQIFVDGAVLDAVNNLLGTGTVGIAVNESSYLNGTGLVGSEGLVDQAVRQADAWTSYGHFDEVDGLEAGLVGSGLTAGAGEAGRGGFAVEAFLHREQLYVLVSNGEAAAGADIRVTLADGRALPGWLTMTRQGVLIGNPPAGLPFVDLRVQSEVDGELVSDTLRIDLSTAVISEHAADQRTHLDRPLFSDALLSDAESGHLEIAALAAALSGEPAE